ncbi:outer membrane protein [Methylosinus sporium]|uniref:Porin family protein n=1 Tax=Methylosinus sporium TaxID=428 RepID=A0A2U1SMF3_METSR|nr:outer membrane beta-barrel protein [Methylosinus sporium]PWB92794.1 porin family protein [Methylosinus sporium]
MKTLSAVGALALAIAAAPAFAADLPSQKAAPAFVAPVAPAFSWTGFYAGVNIGYGWTDNNNVSGLSSFGLLPVSAWSYGASNADGVLGGVQIGYNHQFAGTGFVVGLEADFQGADLKGSTGGFGFGLLPSGVTANQRLDWFGTVRGRVGYAVLPTLLVYGTGGFAYGEGSTTLSYVDGAGFAALGSENGTRTGWTAGGGVEWAFLPNWSAKVEYLYTELERGNAIGVPTFPAVLLVSQRGVENHFHTVRVGLNYHFNLFGAPAPVIAKY